MSYIRTRKTVKPLNGVLVFRLVVLGNGVVKV